VSFPIFKSRYFWFVVAFAFIYKLIALIIYTYYPQKLSLVWSEGNVGENIAAGAWGVGLILVLVKFIFFFGKNDKWIMWLWCFFAFFLGFTRELDLHKKLEEFFGLSWKVQWMGDSDVSIFLKVIIILLMILTVGGMLGSVLWKHRSIIRELKAGNMLVSIFIMGMIYMAFGFLFDGSVLGNNGLFDLITRSYAKLCEEVFETIAASLACLAVLPFFYKKNTLFES